MSTYFLKRKSWPKKPSRAMRTTRPRRKKKKGISSEFHRLAHATVGEEHPSCCWRQTVILFKTIVSWDEPSRLASRICTQVDNDTFFISLSHWTTSHPRATPRATLNRCLATRVQFFLFFLSSCHPSGSDEVDQVQESRLETKLYSKV